MAFNTLEYKQYLYGDGSVRDKMPYPWIDYEHSVDGGEMAREQMRKEMLTGLAMQTNPLYRLHKNDPLTNLDEAINYQRQEIDDSADWWKSLGRVPYQQVPYADLSSAVDAMSRRETANNFVDYANAEAENPLRKPDNFRNPDGLINAYVNNIYNKLMKR